MTTLDILRAGDGPWKRGGAATGVKGEGVTGVVELGGRSPVPIMLVNRFVFHNVHDGPRNNMDIISPNYHF